MDDCRRYYSLAQPANEGGAAHLYIFGDIVESGYEWTPGDASPLSVVQDLAGVTAPEIQVHIDSYGGDTSAGLAIYNTLAAHPARIITIAEGFAASAASLIFMAGEERLMRPSSLLMIHNAWTSASGNADQLRDAASDLDKISDVAAGIYRSHCNMTADQLAEMLTAETWLQPAEALTYGFATGITDAPRQPIYQSSVREAVRQAILAAQTHPAPAEPTNLTPFECVFGDFAR